MDRQGPGASAHVTSRQEWSLPLVCPVANQLKVPGEAACTYTRGRRGGRDTLAAVVYQRVVSKHGSLAGGDSWKVTVEDYKQEWTKNGSLGNSWWDALHRWLNTIDVCANAATTQVAFKPLQFNTIDSYTAEFQGKQGVIYSVKSLGHVQKAGVCENAIIKSFFPLVDNWQKLPDSRALENRQKFYWYSPYTTLLGIDHKSNRLPIFGCIVNRQTRRRLPYPIVDRKRTVIQFQTAKPSNPSKQRRIKPSSATNLSTQRRETSCRQENSTEITSRKRSDCKLQELCNNCERTVKNNEGTVPKNGKRGSIYRQSSGILKMCTDEALLRKRMCIWEKMVKRESVSWFNDNTLYNKEKYKYTQARNTIMKLTLLLANYLIVTIICEYKILRFGDSDDFAGIIFCDFTKSS